MSIERILMYEQEGYNMDLIDGREFDFNKSLDEIISHINGTLFQQYQSNRAVGDDAFIALICTYAVFIVTGSVGNGLVCLVVFRKPQMRTARNVFIINLAVSDLLLCLFTMPFTLVELLLKHWPLGVVLCKLVSALQATSIFVSTFSITAIALDRYHVIVYPTHELSKRLGVAAILTTIWIIAFLLSLPLFLVRRVDSFYIGLPGLESVEFCIEQWPISNGRAYYSVMTLLIQYVLPSVIVSVSHVRISRKLQNRMANRLKSKASARDNEPSGVKDTSNPGQSSKGGKDGGSDAASSRMQRTNTLLMMIALIFGISWLPLNIINLAADMNFAFLKSDSFKIWFACCHMMGMSSACSNPLLYGWLNENFRKEFKEIFYGCKKTIGNLTPSSFKHRSENHPADGGNNNEPTAIVMYTCSENITLDSRRRSENTTIVTNVNNT